MRDFLRRYFVAVVAGVIACAMGTPDFRQYPELWTVVASVLVGGWVGLLHDVSPDVGQAEMQQHRITRAVNVAAGMILTWGALLILLGLITEAGG